MGLKKLFSRGKKVPKETAQPITPTPTDNINEDGASKDNSEIIRTPASSISNQVSQSVPSNIHSSDLIKDKDTPQDLWDEAYAALTRREPSLTTKYEEIILMQEEENSSPGQENLDGGLALIGSYQREEQLRQIVKTKVDEINLKEWQIQAGSHSINISGQFEKAVKVVIAVKDFVSSAVSSEPHAALAWAGVCVFLPLLVNPAEQKSAARDGLESIPFAVRRMRVMERLIRPGIDELIEHNYPPDSAEIVRDFESTATELYEKIIEFQIRLVKQYSQTWAKRYGRDIFKFDDWADLTRQIKSLEARCTEISRDLSQERIERALGDSDQKIQSGLQKIQQELEQTTRGINQQTMIHSAWRQTDEERECIQLFRKANPYENQKNRTPRRVLETGNWFLENQEFLNWRKKEGPGLLWLSAMPGTGKSVLARTLIDEDLTTLSHQKDSVVCYFFFKDISPYQRSARSAISAVLHQLFSTVPSLVKHALFPYELNGKELLQLLSEMFDILCKAATDPAVGQVVCVLDALDECESEDRMTLIEMITCFYQKAMFPSDEPPKLKFLLTSRPYSNIYSQFHDLMRIAPTIHLSGDQESEKIKHEIDHVIDVDVSKLAARKGLDYEATEYLLDHLHKVENRTYLWLSLIMEEIRLSERPGNKRELRKIVSDLPRSLVDAFDAILKRCRHPDLARQLLHIILAARQPLTIDEMKVATALADDLEYRSYEELSFESPEDFELRLKNICGLFVTVEDGSVFLIHQAAKDFLIQVEENDQRDSESWRHTFKTQDSEELVATVCISLLSFKCFSKKGITFESDEVSINEYADNHPLLKYAAVNWMEHSTRAEIDKISKWVPVIMSLCDIHEPLFKTWHAVHQVTVQPRDRIPQNVTSLNLAAGSQFVNVVATLLNKGEDPNERDGHGATPLTRAVQSKSMEAVELLLDANADINESGWDEPWFVEIDDDGSEREVKSFSGTPLTMAVVSGNYDMVEYLIHRGAAINFPFDTMLTPLVACIFQIIFSTDEDEETETKNICRLLLRHGADVSFPTLTAGGPNERIERRTALHYVADTPDHSLLQMFVEYGTVNLDCQSWFLREEPSEDLSDSEDVLNQDHKQPIFSDGSRDGEILSDLVEITRQGTLNSDESLSISDNNSDAESDTGFTPLHLAVRAGRFEHVRILLENGANMHIKSAQGYTAMDMAHALSDYGNISSSSSNSNSNPSPSSSSSSDVEDAVKPRIIALLQHYEHGPPTQPELSRQGKFAVEPARKTRQPVDKIVLFPGKK